MSWAVVCKRQGRVGSGGCDRPDSGRRHIVGRLCRHRLPVGRLRQQSGSTKRTELHPVHGRVDEHGRSIEHFAQSDVLDFVTARRHLARFRYLLTTSLQKQLNVYSLCCNYGLIFRVQDIYL